MEKRNLSWTLRLLSFVLIGLLGCATAHITQLPVRPTSEFTLRQAKGGVRVAVDPVLEGARSKSLFGTDLYAGESILPVLVVVENGTDSRQIFLEKDDIRLSPVTQESASRIAVLEGDKQHLQAAAQDWIRVTEPVRLEFEVAKHTLEVSPGLLAAGTVVALWGAAIVYAQIMNFTNSQIIHYNIVDKAFPDRTIPPGGANQGFVYFAPVKSTDDLSIEIILRSRNHAAADSMEYLAFVFPLPAQAQGRRR
jgi:hypothetical protein